MGIIKIDETIVLEKSYVQASINYHTSFVHPRLVRRKLVDGFSFDFKSF